MKKEHLIILGMTALGGAALFFDDALAFFAGMSPLEAVKTIFTFILHVAVGTIAATVALGLPKIVRPWLKMLKRRQRQAWRAGPNAQWRVQTPKMRLTAEERALMLLAKLQGMGRRDLPPRPPSQLGRGSENEPTIRFRL